MLSSNPVGVNFSLGSKNPLTRPHTKALGPRPSSHLSNGKATMYGWGLGFWGFSHRVRRHFLLNLKAAAAVLTAPVEGFFFDT